MTMTYTKRGNVSVPKRIIADYDTATAYLRKSKTGAKLVDAFEQSYTEMIASTDGYDDGYAPLAGKLRWAPRAGTVIRRGMESPALGLAHEMRHEQQREEGFDDTGYGMMTLMGVTPPSEADAVKVEAKIAKELGEPVRIDYDDGTDTFDAPSPTYHKLA